jgi:hypothetical protein
MLGTRLQILLVFAAIVWFSVAVPDAYGQWTHVINVNDHQKDCAFSGTGPANAVWYCDLHSVQGSGMIWQLVFLEVDVGTVNGGGNYAGQYKRTEVPIPDWKLNVLHRSANRTPQVPVVVDFFFF